MRYAKRPKSLFAEIVFPKRQSIFDLKVSDFRPEPYSASSCARLYRSMPSPTDAQYFDQKKRPGKSKALFVVCVYRL